MNQPDIHRAPHCHKIRYGVTGAPVLDGDDMDGSHAPGVGLAPDLIEFVYSPARDGKPASVAASVTGVWTRFGEREPSHARVTTHFADGPDDWPQWLAAEARLHDPERADADAFVAQAAEKLTAGCPDHGPNGGWLMTCQCEAIDELRRLAAAPAAEEQPESETPQETVHACPPDGSGLTPCCGRTPFELPRTDRISSEAPVTCTGPVSGEPS